ncbi:hypothetical protein [Streptomyces indicus]|uniref:Uncharacterized protein n=1 Tax=Streptomyces indicus TaxID=417292 RepID=A0A1G9HVZ0_9ACTN|nr:hypothetical protein [Streptomyces indicus]SDL16986.1 hypothetical protein SAMN05421806_12068 [Streptomyces indicus]
MSSATFTPGPVRTGPPSGATATGTVRHTHRVGNALRAVKVFARAAMDVVVLGEYAQDAGVVRRRPAHRDH